MDFDFSQVNLQYLIQARDLARKDTDLVATLLGIPSDLAHLLATLKAHELARVARIKPPLLMPRPDTWWWSRLFTAVRDGRSEEIEAVIEHAALITVT